MVKISRRYSTILFGIIMSLVMSFTMSLTLTLINLGFIPEFLGRWARAFGISFIVALPTSLMIVPLARKIVEKITSD